MCMVGVLPRGAVERVLPLWTLTTNLHRPVNREVEVRDWQLALVDHTVRAPRRIVNVQWLPEGGAVGTCPELDVRIFTCLPPSAVPVDSGDQREITSDVSRWQKIRGRRGAAAAVRRRKSRRAASRVQMLKVQRPWQHKISPTHSVPADEVLGLEHLRQHSHERGRVRERRPRLLVVDRLEVAERIAV
jgi:hypothetical protein